MLKLVIVNLMRNKLRTVLTMASVTVALFLFCTLGGVLDSLQEAIKVGSESRLIVRNKISLVQWIPMSYRQRIQSVPGVKRVAVQNWFGARDPNDERGFFAQFAVDDPYMAIYGKDIDIVQSSEAQAAAASSGEGFCAAELHRLKGDVLLQRGEAYHDAGAAQFRQALQLARQQQARWWELRTAMSWSRLLRRQGQLDAAHTLVAQVYQQFTEGFETLDMQEAGALLAVRSG